VQIIATAWAIDVKRFAAQIQAVEDAGSHCPWIDLVKLYAATGNLCVFEALRAGDRQREICPCVQPSFFAAACERVLFVYSSGILIL